MVDESDIDYSTILNGVHIPAAVFDEDKRLVDFNLEAREIRTDLQERIGEPHTSVFDDKVAMLFDEVSEGEMTSRVVELSYGGEVMRFDFGVSQTDSMYIVTVLELTEMADMRQKLNSLEKQLEQLTSMLSHDTTTPVMVAKGRIELVRESLDSDEFTDEIDSLETAEESIEQVDRLITDIVDLFSEGKSDVYRESIGFKTTCEEAWEEYVKTGSAELNIESNGVIYADKSKLKLLLGNLFKNAVVHNAEPVTVTVEFKRGGFTVYDDGEGFDTDNPRELFSFGETTDPHGSGVGLTIVETVADSHGWCITVDESESGGAKFVINNALTGDEESNVDIQIVDD